MLTLGLAIGATTAIFSFVNSLLIRPFPFRDHDQLVEIRSIRGGEAGKLSMAEIVDVREQIPGIAAIAAHTGDAGGYNFSGNAGGRPEEWRAILATGNIFEVLGLPLAAGVPWPQTFDRGHDYRVILSHAVWQRNFGGNPNVVGTTITLDHAPGYKVYGVAPKGVDFPRGIEVYRSLGGYASYEQRGARGAVGIARMKPGYTVAQLQGEIDALAARLASQFPTTNDGLTIRASSFRDIYSGDVRPYLLVLMGAVAFVLLIACGNVVNLLLTRALGREQEIAVRVSIGARRTGIVGQLLAESVVLSLLAAGVGIGLAFWWIRLLRVLTGARLPEWMTVDIDGRVLAFAVVLAIGSGLLSGLAPAFHAYRKSFGASLKEGARGSTSGSLAGRLRDSLVVAEVALALVLLAGAGTLMRGFIELQAQEKGFDATSLSTFRIALGWKRYDGAATVRYYERAMEQIAAVPGVDGVGLVYSPPLAGLEIGSPNTVQAEGQSVDVALKNPYVQFQSTSETYFGVMGIPVVSGRRFSAFDREGSEPVAIISQRLANLLWPGQDAIGRRLLYNPLSKGPNAYRTVIGVVGNVQQRELAGEPSLDLYVPFRQTSAANPFVIVKSSLPPREFQRSAEAALWAIDAEQSLFDFQTYEQRILASVWQLRVSQLLLTLFGGVAVALSAVGIYGVMSYLAGQRTREIGIRLALGATPGGVRSMVVSRGLWLGAIGLAVGVAGAVLQGRLLAAAIQGVPALDVASMAAAAMVLVLVTMAACGLPAWRASRTDPVEALRDA